MPSNSLFVQLTICFLTKNQSFNQYFKELFCTSSSTYFSCATATLRKEGWSNVVMTGVSLPGPCGANLGGTVESTNLLRV